MALLIAIMFSEIAYGTGRNNSSLLPGPLNPTGTSKWVRKDFVLVHQPGQQPAGPGYQDLSMKLARSASAPSPRVIVIRPSMLSLNPEQPGQQLGAPFDAYQKAGAIGFVARK